MEDKTVIFLSKEYVSKKIDAGYNYLETLGFRLMEGRFFRENSASDLHESIIVNEAFVKSLNLEKPIGSRLIIDGSAYYIIGVVSDFHFVNFRHDIKPLFFQLSRDKSFNYLAFKTLPGKVSEAESYAKNIWKKLYPDNTYEGFFQNSAFDVYFKENRGISSLMISIASITMLISCMGLFGLVSLLISKRLKEFSIRKVLGATIFQVGKQINEGFIWVLIISMVFAIPFSILGVNSIINSIYTYHVPITAWPFLLTSFLLIFTAILTVSTQILKAAKVNPAVQLRNE
jgi:ABC-type antimicrobial peptide transport system permease subunit